MKKILVISPSGEVYNHDSVRWYSALPFATHPNHYHNIGDAFVFDSSLKLLSFSRLKAMNIRDATDAEIEWYNSEFDYAFLRGSNYLHNDMDWENAPAVLAKLRIPVVAFGIGAQASSKRPLMLSQAARRVLELIAERSVSIGVRGNYTADVLWSIGIRNVRVIACPTIFRNNDPGLRIDLPSLDTVRDVAYTLRREVDAAYAQDRKRYLDTQRETILDLAARYQIEILAQGEIEEKNILWGDPDQRATALQKLRHEGWLRGQGDHLERLYEDRLFYSDVVSEFEAKLCQKDLVLGYRLHGNLLGLANRVPSVYFTYDSRTAEFAETLQIPSFDVFSGKVFRLEDYWEQSLFERFNRAYYHTYRAMRLFLDENRVAHKMLDEVAATAAVQGPSGMSCLNPTDSNKPIIGPAIVGYVEGTTTTAIVGWVWRQGHNDRLTVELRRDEKSLVRSVADGMRDDLAQNGIGDGRHSFTLALPSGFHYDPSSHQVVAVADDGTSVVLAAPPLDGPRSGVPQLQRGIDMLLGSHRLMHRNLQAVLTREAPSAAKELAEIASIQTRIEENLATVELCAIRIEQLLNSRQPENPPPSSRLLLAVATLAGLALLVSCAALYRVIGFG